MIYLGWIACLSGISGAILLSAKKSYSYIGWLLYAFASGLWVFMAYEKRLWPLFISSLIFFILETKGYLKYRKSKLIIEDIPSDPV